MLELYIPQATYKGINLKVDINEQTKHVDFERYKVLQIIGNLISNAIKFTPSNGTIQVSLDMVVNAHQNCLDFTVTDSGIGIEQHRLDQLLSGKAGSTVGTGEEKGYGFGLPLVKHLVDKLGGSLSIHSMMGQGTTFKVSLPQRPI